jgi:DNA mismatch repair protein MSH5
VYGLFHHLAHTPQGKTLLRQFFLRPSLNLGVIEERLDTVGTFVRPENADALDKLVKELQSVKNLRVIMINLRKGAGGGSGKVGGVSKNVWAGIRQVMLVPLVGDCSKLAKTLNSSSHSTL